MHPLLVLQSHCPNPSFPHLVRVVPFHDPTGAERNDDERSHQGVFDFLLLHDTNVSANGNPEKRS